MRTEDPAGERKLPTLKEMQEATRKARGETEKTVEEQEESARKARAKEQETREKILKDDEAFKSHEGVVVDENDNVIAHASTDGEVSGGKDTEQAEKQGSFHETEELRRQREKD